MKRVRIGMIGCGFIAETIHIPNLLSIPEARLVSLCDVNEDKVRQVSRKFNLREFYSEAHEMLRKSDIDAVMVCSPTSTPTSLAVEWAGACPLKQAKRYSISTHAGAYLERCLRKSWTL